MQRRPNITRFLIQDTRIRWLTALAVAAVVALNVAGIWGITVAYRGAIEQAGRVLRLETAARAQALESLLSSTRADLLFLTGSQDLSSLDRALASDDPREARWRRLGAEAALLLFLRGHPLVTHVVVRSGAAAVLVQAGRRGGVPVLWRATQGAAVDPQRQRITARVEFGSAPGSGGVSLEAEIDPAVLVAHGPEIAGGPRPCELREAGGAMLAGGTQHEGSPNAAAGSAWLSAEADLRAEGWSVPSPWKLICREPQGAATALLEPLTARYRLTLGLNLAVMALALLLGSFAIVQVRRRERLEAQAREEARVREVERQLFHSERLSTVGRLAAGMAHEINNPLEGMANYLSLAMDAVRRGDAGAARAHLDGVRQGLEGAASVVRQVLVHAEPDRAPLAPLDLNAVVAQSVDFVRSRQEFASIRFVVDMPPATLRVRGNQTMLGQVLLNLLLNACEAQSQGGEVTVSTRAANGVVVAEVADRGPGVPPEDATRIFEPFFTTKRSTGLGLSICHAIVRQHGGDLTVASREGGGAVFRMAFPALERTDG